MKWIQVDRRVGLLNSKSLPFWAVLSFTQNFDCSHSILMLIQGIRKKRFNTLISTSANM